MFNLHKKTRLLFYTGSAIINKNVMRRLIFLIEGVFMKKLICVFLSLIMIFGISFSAVASSDVVTDQSSSVKSEYPFVLVRGMDFSGLYLDYGTENEKNCIQNLSFINIMKTIIKGVGAYVKTGSIRGLMDVALEYTDSVLGSMACDNNGDSLYNVSVETYPTAVSDYPELLNDDAASMSNERGILKSAAERYGAENVYYFTYDWRLDPSDTADSLNALIEQAKADHNAEKVNIICCSMGGVVVDFYMYEYGFNSINKCVFNSSTFCGTYVTTDLLSGKVEITETALYNYFSNLIDSSFVADCLSKIGVFDSLSKLAMTIIDSEKEYVYDSFLRDTFCTMPAVWALVQPEKYDECIDYMFPTEQMKEEYAGLISRADELQKVMAGMDDLLLSLPENGVKVVVVGSYNTPLIPVYESAATQGDGVLETALMLGGANVTNIGESFDESYIASDPEKLSPDRCVDLSSVLFPEYTWAIKDAEHVSGSYGTDYSDFLFWLIDYDGQPTVSSSDRYPQFMVSDSEGSLAVF